MRNCFSTSFTCSLFLAHPYDAPSTASLLVLSGGPAIYLLGSAIYKKIVYDTVPITHIAGVLALAALTPLLFKTNVLLAGWITTAVMLAVCAWEAKILRHRKPADAPQT